jgi:hypothetical protein
LKEWLERALYACFEAGRSTITRADLEAARMPRGKLLKSIEENDRGLAELRLLDSSDAELERAMRMRPAEKVQPRVTRPRLLPGTRKPVRDPVDAASAA